MAAMAFPSSRNETSSYTHSYSSAFASSSVTNFTPRASPVIMQSSSSTANVKLHSHRNSPRSPPSPSSTVRFSVEQRPESMTVTKDSRNNNAVSSSSTTEKPPRKCMCSPTTHAGSFRCAYHKRMADQEQKRQQKQEQVQQRQQKEEKIQKQQQQQQQQQRLQTAWSRSRTLNLRRSAMKNSLVRIGVEGEMMKITLTNLIRPLSHLLRRREAFQPKPSRLSVMSKA